MSTSSRLWRLAHAGTRWAIVALVVVAIFGMLAPSSAKASVFDNRDWDSATGTYVSLRWPTGDDGLATIPVCIIDGGSAEQRHHDTPGIIHDDNPSLSEVIQHVRSALSSSWERYGAVRFTGWSNCDGLPDLQRAKTVGLYIHPDADNKARVGTGSMGRTKQSSRGVQFKPWGNDADCIEYNPSTTHAEYSFECVEQYAIHEFGHVLGFTHEWSNPSRPAGCKRPEDDRPALPDSYDTSYNPDKDYTVVNPNNYDWDSIMTYDEDCANVTGRRFGSTNLSYWDIVGLQAVYPQTRHFDVGVIPVASGCRESEEVAFYMDNEDEDANSWTSGWTGGWRVDGRGNSQMVFCREDGAQFAPVAAGDYAVLKLGDVCPAGSTEFIRHFDNEDDDNKNSVIGRAGQNGIVLSGAGLPDINLYFCLFSTRYASPMAAFPRLPFEYGVLAADTFGGAIERGLMRTDDEDDSNKNWLMLADKSAGPSIGRIMETSEDTILHLAKVSARRGLTAITADAIEVTSESATLHGIANAWAGTASVRFEWGTVSGRYTNSASAAPAQIEGGRDKPVNVVLKNLAPSTTYYYRVAASNLVDTIYGAERSFTTTAVAPIVTTEAASDITSASATLHATINAQNAHSSVWFIYQAIPNPVQFTMATPQMVGGTDNTVVTAQLSGLTPNTRYQYRVVAQNAGGQSRGDILEFTTAPAATDDRYSTDEDTALTIAAPGLLANDSLAEGNLLTPVLVSGPLSGTLALNPDGSFAYTPNANFNGSDSFTYKVSNGLDSNIATARITVNPVDDTATLAIAPGGQCALENGPSATIELSLADVDTAVDALAVTASSSNQLLLPDSSTVISGTGATRTLSLVAAPRQHGQASITIAVSDGQSSTATTVDLLVGTTNADVLSGTDGVDIIFGLQGTDTIMGLGGGDLLCGNDGDDTIDGGDGSDAIYAGDSDDYVLGGAGDDLLDGGKGDDALDGGAGDDTLAGWSGRDALSGGDGDDTLTGGNSDDALDGGVGDDALDGGKGDDRLTGGLGADAFYASLGRDQETDFDAGQGDSHPSAAGPALRSLVEWQDAEPDSEQ